MVKPSVFNNGRRCPKCSGNLRMTEKLLRDRLYEKHHTNYSLIKYSGYSNKPSIFKHNVCGVEFSMRANNILNQGNECPYCTGRGNWTQEMFEKKIDEIVGDEYSLIGEFINYRNKVHMKHNLCGHTWYVSPGNFVNEGVSSRCPHCAITVSKGEKKILSFLTENNIDFSFDETFKGSRFRPDFIIPELSLVIEYDGIQHFVDKSLFERIEEIRKRDTRKNIMMRENGFSILRISYKEYDNVESILKDIILDKKFNDYRNASTIEAYWKRKTNIYLEIFEDIV